MTTERRLRIVLVAGFFPIRSETFIEQKAFELAERGHAVWVMATSGNPGEADPLLWEGTGRKPQVRYLPLDGRLRCGIRTFGMLVRALFVEPAFVVSLTRGLRRESLGGFRLLEALYRTLPFAGIRPDVVHIEFTGNAVRWHELFTLSCPVVVSCRGSDILLHPRVDAKLRDKLPEVFRRATAVHLVSQDLMDRAMRDFGLDPSKAAVIRPSVPLERFSPLAVPRESDELTRIITVARVHWVKGYVYALQAIALLKESGRRVLYTVVGDGDEEAMSELLLARQEFGLTSEVSIKGAMGREAVSKELANSDLYLMPSLSEGISSAAVEAMAAGLPVVSTRVGGMAELLRDGVDGLLVPARDSQEMAAALEKLIVDPTLARGMGASGRARVEESFSLEGEVDAFVDLYRRSIEIGRSNEEMQRSLVASD